MTVLLANVHETSRGIFYVFIGPVYLGLRAFRKFHPKLILDPYQIYTHRDVYVYTVFI